jgi:hypothetical protein
VTLATAPTTEKEQPNGRLARSSLRQARRSPAGLILKIDIRELLPGAVPDDEAGVVVFLDRAGRREAAGGIGDAGSRVSRHYVNFAGEKVIVSRRNVIWKASITLGLG